MFKQKIKRIEKLFEGKKGKLVFKDSIYIKWLNELIFITQLLEQGEINWDRKIFITKKVHDALNKSPEEIEKIMNEYERRHKIRSGGSDPPTERAGRNPAGAGQVV